MISLIISMATISFFTTKTEGLNRLLFIIENLSKNPLDIYNLGIKFFLTFIIPFGLANYYSSQALLGRITDPMIIIFSFVSVIIFFISALKFWDYGLRRYSSASS